MILWFVTFEEGINPSNSFEKGKTNRAGHFRWLDRAQLSLDTRRCLWGPSSVSDRDLDVWAGWKPWDEPNPRAVGAGPQSWLWAQLTQTRQVFVGMEGPCPCPYLPVATVACDNEGSAWPRWVFHMHSAIWLFFH